MVQTWIVAYKSFFILQDVIDVEATEPTNLHKHIPREAMQGHMHSFEHKTSTSMPSCDSCSPQHTSISKSQTRHRTTACNPTVHMHATGVTSTHTWLQKESVSQSRARAALCVCVCERAEMIGQMLFPLCLFRAQSKAKPSK
jgi:hypothetical protein